MTLSLPILKPRTMTDILNDWDGFDDGLDDILGEPIDDELDELDGLTLTGHDTILGRF